MIKIDKLLTSFRIEHFVYFDTFFSLLAYFYFGKHSLFLIVNNFFIRVAVLHVFQSVLKLLSCKDHLLLIEPNRVASIGGVIISLAAITLLIEYAMEYILHVFN